MKSIVIVGGGFAGLSVAKHLRKAKNVQVTLIDRKDYFEVTPAQVLALTDPQAKGGRGRFLYKAALGEDFVQAEVVGLEANAVRLSSGQTLAFDTLILALGTKYPHFQLAKPWNETNLDQRQTGLQLVHEEFKAALSYQIIGGGLVGIEMAGQIATAATGKKVRLVHKGPRLVEGLLPKASALALDHLQKLGVEVHLNSNQLPPTAGEMILQATSPQPSTEFLKAVKPNLLNEAGYIKVDENFEIFGHPNWFAIGDVSSSADSRLATIAAAQGAWLAGFLTGKTAKYKPRPKFIIVPLGSRHGFSQMPFGVVTWKLVLNMKRKDHLISLIRKDFGADT